MTQTRPFDIFIPQLGANNAPNTRVTPTGNTSTQLLAANSARKYAIFSNFSGATFYIKFGQTAVVQQGVTIPNGAIYEMNATNLFLGAVNGIVASNGRTIDMCQRRRLLHLVRLLRVWFPSRVGTA